jgi:hypothetical protein
VIAQSSFLGNHGNKILWSRGIIWGFYGLWGMNMKKHNECDKFILSIEGLFDPR